MTLPQPLLVIDASTYRGSAAIVEGDRVLGEVEVQMRGAEEERLMPAVAALLRDSGVSLAGLGGVVCGQGPGSFTSLRIAASIAKGLVTATGHPLFTVSSLLLVVAGAVPLLGAGRYLAMLDAMRGECFAARVTVDATGTPALEGEFELLDARAAREVSAGEGRIAVGPGRTVDVSPHARGVARLARGGLGSPADVAAWEPSYGRLAEAQARWERSHGRALVP